MGKKIALGTNNINGPFGTAIISQPDSIEEKILFLTKHIEELTIAFNELEKNQNRTTKQF